MTAHLKQFCNRKRALIVSSVLLSVLCLLLGGCYGNGVNELGYTRERPALTNLVGGWIPTQETQKLMKREGGYVISIHQLTLSSNGMFWMTNMPDWWLDGFGHSKKGFEHGSGKWELEVYTNGWNPAWKINLEFTNTNGEVQNVVSRLHVFRQKPPYLIHIGIGDPDGGVAMYFEREADISTNGSSQALQKRN